MLSTSRAGEQGSKPHGMVADQKGYRPPRLTSVPGVVRSPNPPASKSATCPRQPRSSSTSTTRVPCLGATAVRKDLSREYCRDPCVVTAAEEAPKLPRRYETASRFGLRVHCTAARRVPSGRGAALTKLRRLPDFALLLCEEKWSVTGGLLLPSLQHAPRKGTCLKNVPR